jgi:hypothetical protein
MTRLDSPLSIPRQQLSRRVNRRPRRHSRRRWPPPAVDVVVLRSLSSLASECRGPLS